MLSPGTESGWGQNRSPSIRQTDPATHRAKLDGKADLARFGATLEKVCVDTVEAGFITKDLALLVGPDQRWLSTTGFLDRIDVNLKRAMAA